MALTSSDDISVVLSGGTVNLDPNKSLGGDPSTAPVADNILNNLFDDVSPIESDDGHEDYRCIYFFNDGITPIYSLDVFIAEDFEGGAVVELGIEDRNETQRITLSGGIITGGSMTLNYEGIEFDSTFDSDLGAWATDLQQTLNSLTDGGGDRLLTDVVVNAQTTGPTLIIFDIIFAGQDGNRNHAKLLEIANNFTPSGINITITTPQEGAPINTIAPQIGLDTTPPGGVGFFAPSAISPIQMPLLRPEDGFPLWIKRTIDPGTSAVANDGLKIRVVGEALEPPEGS